MSGKAFGGDKKLCRGRETSEWLCHAMPHTLLFASVGIIYHRVSPVMVFGFRESNSLTTLPLITCMTIGKGHIFSENKSFSVVKQNRNTSQCCNEEPKRDSCKAIINPDLNKWCIVRGSTSRNTFFLEINIRIFYKSIKCQIKFC